MNRIFESGYEPLTLEAVLEAFEVRHESCSEASNGYTCDRKPGHTGAHVAQMGNGEIAQIWYDQYDEALYESLKADAELIHH